MTTSDWITLVSVIIAALAIAVSGVIALIAVKVQRDQANVQRNQAETERKQAQEDAEKDLADVSQVLASKVAQLFTLPPIGPAMATALSDVTGLVIRANELVNTSSKVTWYLYYSLALAYGWLWDIDKATANWKKALAEADSSHNRLLVLVGEATFYYNMGSIEAGRNCFTAAEGVLADVTGDLGQDQLTQITTQRAWQEYFTGETGQAATAFAEAWTQCGKINTAWRQTRARQFIVTAFSQTFGQAQTPPPNTIPADLIASIAALSQQQAQQTAALAQQTAVFAQQTADSLQSTMQRPFIPQSFDSQAASQRAADRSQAGPFSGS